MESNKVITLIKYLKSFSDFFFNVAIPELPVFFFHLSTNYVSKKIPLFLITIVTSTKSDTITHNSTILISLGHQPDELIEADISVAVHIDHVDQVLQLFLGGRPTKGSHHLANEWHIGQYCHSFHSSVCLIIHKFEANLKK